jgi:hypothetical protein
MARAERIRFADHELQPLFIMIERERDGEGEQQAERPKNRREDLTLVRRLPFFLSPRQKAMAPRA